MDKEAAKGTKSKKEKKKEEREGAQRRAYGKE